MTRVVESLNHALRQCLEDDPSVYLLGEDILDPYGGAFRVTQGLSTAFPERVLTTPVSEAGIVGAGVGMALRGLRPVVEIMFGDFLMLAGDALLNHAAKMHWMSGGQVDVPLVVRTPMGGRRGYGATHSQTLEKHLLGSPGLRTLAANALQDPGELLAHAIQREHEPVLFVEHKLLYAEPIGGGLDAALFEWESGPEPYPSMRIRLKGSPRIDLSMASYGYMASLALQAVRRLAYEHEIFAELVVYTQLGPFDASPILPGLQQSGRLLTIEEGARSLGWGAEVVAAVVESYGPVSASRVAAADTPIPASQPLEDFMLPDVDDIVGAAERLRKGDARVLVGGGRGRPGRV